MVAPEYSTFEIDDLVACLRTGYNHATSRRALCRMLDMPDRKVRELIEKARREGALILTRQDGGYYLATEDDIEELVKFYHKEYARAVSILARLKTTRKIIKEAGAI